MAFERCPVGEVYVVKTVLPHFGVNLKMYDYFMVNHELLQSLASFFWSTLNFKDESLFARETHAKFC